MTESINHPAVPAGWTHTEVQDLLGEDLDTFSADEQRLLGALLDPAIAEYTGEDTDHEAVAEFYEGFDSSGDLYDPQRVADRLSAHYDLASPPGERSGFSFGFESNADREVTSYNVSHYVEDLGSYITDHHDIKYLDSERMIGGTNPTGLRRALALVVYIDADYQRVKRQAEKVQAALAQANPDRQEV